MTTTASDTTSATASTTASATGSSTPRVPGALRARHRRTPRLSTLPLARTGTTACPLPHEAATFTHSPAVPSRERAQYIARFGFLVPTPELVQLATSAIAWGGCTGAIDVGAGAGYFASLLAREGIDVDASDLTPPRAVHHPVRAASAVEAIHTCPDAAARLLILVWPPYAMSMAADALAAFPGDLALYVGEGAGDCCADDRFFAALRNGWQAITRVLPTRFDGIHDTATLYRRR